MQGAPCYGIIAVKRQPMHPCQVNVQVFDEYLALASPDWLRKVAEKALALEASEAPLEMDLAVVDDDAVKTLNKQYRGLDENTDVLSFSFLHPGRYYGLDKPPGESAKEEVSFTSPPGKEAGLGEVIISYPQARRQAVDSGHSVEQELALLVAHGVLHLLGYEHVEPVEEAAMKEKEARIMAAVLE